MKAITTTEKKRIVQKYLMTRAKEDLIAMIVYTVYKKSFTELFKLAKEYMKAGGVL